MYDGIYADPKEYPGLHAGPEGLSLLDLLSGSFAIGVGAVGSSLIQRGARSQI